MGRGSYVIIPSTLFLRSLSTKEFGARSLRAGSLTRNRKDHDLIVMRGVLEFLHLFDHLDMPLNSPLL